MERRTWVSIIKGGARRLAGAPGVAHLRRLAHDVEFANGRPRDGYSGVFATVEEAIKAAPPGRPVGYDLPELAALYRQRMDSLIISDYAALFWLRPALEGARTVFDFGGHVGIAYYAFRRYLRLPPDLTWRVCDVPSVVAGGKTLAREQEATQLDFTTRPEDADGADIFMAAGSLQYVEAGFLQRLIAGLRSRPRHIIVQRTPLHEDRSFVTIQATGPAFCAYSVAQRGPFVDGLVALGYELVDSWRDGRVLDVPFHPECRVSSYSGLYLRLHDRK
jgi:putative methyltransferase (TIGR04325 family)